MTNADVTRNFAAVDLILLKLNWGSDLGWRENDIAQCNDSTVSTTIKVAEFISVEGEWTAEDGRYTHSAICERLWLVLNYSMLHMYHCTNRQACSGNKATWRFQLSNLTAPTLTKYGVRASTSSERFGTKTPTFTPTNVTVRNRITLLTFPGFAL